eukprot:m.40155 g.40155  ORF g.40155 m.40155 type:complete len:1571 (+) comp5596_c0_seq1:138-4850(+)
MAELKEAKAAIQEKRFADAARICKELLAREPRNYNALVLCGLAHARLEKYDVAEKHYSDAGALSPENGLAWQGLIDLYEKNGDRLTDVPKKLAAAYRKRVALPDLDAAKKYDMTVRLAECVARFDAREAASTLQAAGSLKELSEPEKQAAAVRVVALLTQHEDACIARAKARDLGCTTRQARVQNLRDDPPFALAVQVAYSALLAAPSPDAEKALLAYSEYLTCALAAGQIAVPVAVAALRALAAALPASPVPRDALCRVAERDDAGVAPDEAAAIAADLHARWPESLFGRIHAGRISPASSVALLDTAATENPDCLSAWVALAEAYLALRDPASALMAARKGAAAAADPACSKMASQLLELQGRVHLLSGAYEAQLGLTAFQKALQLQPGNLAAKAGIAECQILAGACDVAIATCQDALVTSPDSAKILSALGWAFYTSGHPDATATLQRAIAADPALALAHLRLGLALWGTARAQAVPCFLQAAKLDAGNPTPFVYLGHYYCDVGQADRGTRCYQKALSLDPSCEDAGVRLYNIHAGTTQGLDAAKTVLESACNAGGPGRAAWAWLRLGAMHLARASYADAVTCLQNSLKSNAENRLCWELLGDAYAGRGSYVAALKAFTRAVELEPSAVYCLYRIGAMHHVLGDLALAREVHGRVIAAAPRYVAALYDLAMTSFDLAKQARDTGLTIRAASHVGEALVSIDTVLEVSEGIKCVWKLLGDLCTFTDSLPQEHVASIAYGPRLTAVAGGATLLPLGAIAYRHYLVLEESAAIRADLAVNLGLQFKRTATAALGDEAVTAAQQAVMLAPTDGAMWTALGCVCVLTKHEALAQHSFIKAILLNPTGCVHAWASLGVLYQLANQTQLAYKALCAAQALAPSYSSTWAGLSHVADHVSPEESLSLLRQAYELDGNLEACAGLAQQVVRVYGARPGSQRDPWACRCGTTNAAAATHCTACAHMRLDHPLTAAVEEEAKHLWLMVTDSLTKYVSTTRGCSDGWAHNALGAVHEKRGNMEAAADAYGRACALLAGSPHENTAKLNYARAVAATRGAAAAVALWATTAITRWEDWCAVARASFKSGDLPAAYQSFERAMAAATAASAPAHIVADITCAMAMVAFANGDAAGCRALLFKAVADPRECVPAVFALGTLGLLTADGQLALAALAEFTKISAATTAMPSKHTIAFYRLGAVFFSLQGAGRAGRNTILKAVHSFPDQPRVWTYVMQFLNGQACDNAYTDAADVRGHLHESPGGLDESSVDGLFESCLAEVAALLLSGLPAGDRRAIRTAQRAAHLCPERAAGWAALAAALRAHATLRPSAAEWGATLCATRQSMALLPTSPAGASRAATRIHGRHMDLHGYCARTEALAAVMAAAPQEIGHAAALCAQRAAEAGTPELAMQYRLLAAAGQAPPVRCRALIEALQLQPASLPLWTALAGELLAAGYSSEALHTLRLIAALPRAPRPAALARLALSAIVAGQFAFAQENAVAAWLQGEQGDLRTLLAATKLFSGDTAGANKELGKLPALADVAAVVRVRAALAAGARPDAEAVVANTAIASPVAAAELAALMAA